MLVYFLEHGSHNKVDRVDRGVCNNLEMRIPECNPGAGAERSVAIHSVLDLTKLWPPRQR